MSTTTSSEFHIEDKIDIFMKSTIFKYLMILVGLVTIGAAIYDYAAKTNNATASLSSLGTTILGAGVLLFVGRHDKSFRRIANSSIDSLTSSVKRS